MFISRAIETDVIVSYFLGVRVRRSQMRSERSWPTDINYLFSSDVKAHVVIISVCPYNLPRCYNWFLTESMFIWYRLSATASKEPV